MNQPKLGLAMLFGVGFGLLMNVRKSALLQRSAICGSPDVPYGESNHYWYGGECHRDLQFVQLGVEPKIMWAGPNAVIGVYCLVLASCWQAAAKPAGCTRGRRPGALLVGRSGQRDRLKILAYYWDDFAPALATDWDKTTC